MGTLIKIKNKKYTFYLNGRKIYLHTNDGLNQNFAIQTSGFTEIDQFQYARLVDSIYRHKIHNTATLGQHLMCEYRLVPTTRKI